MTAATTEPTRCGCGAEISRWTVRCTDCRVKSIIASAKVVEPSAPLNLVDSDTFFFDLAEAAELEGAQYAHPCDEERLGIIAKHVADDLADRVVEDMCEEAFEDAAGHVEGKAELRAAFEAALDAFNAAQTASSWLPRTHEVFVIPASGTLTEGGDAKQAPGDSLSGPVPKADAQPLAPVHKKEDK